MREIRRRIIIGIKRFRKPKHKKSDNGRSIIALTIAIISIIISVVTFYWNFLRSGELFICKPTGYCLVRGYEELGFESDHLLVPIVIENTGQGAKIFHYPTLLLKEKNNKHKPIRYKLAGFIPNLFRGTMDTPYEIGFGMHIPENSVVHNLLVFHIENWWDITQPDYSKFHFKQGEEWEVFLTYFCNDKEQIWDNKNKTPFFTMTIFPTIDNLVIGGNYNSDCFSIK